MPTSITVGLLYFKLETVMCDKWESVVHISNRKRVLVTGGAGFLGPHLCERFTSLTNDELLEQLPVLCCVPLARARNN
jgi:hypothetical protein